MKNVIMAFMMVLCFTVVANAQWYQPRVTVVTEGTQLYTGAYVVPYRPLVRPILPVRRNVVVGVNVGFTTVPSVTTFQYVEPRPLFFPRRRIFW